MDPDLEADVLEFVSALGSKDAVSGIYEPSEHASGNLLRFFLEFNDSLCRNHQIFGEDCNSG